MKPSRIVVAAVTMSALVGCGNRTTAVPTATTAPTTSAATPASPATSSPTRTAAAGGQLPTARLLARPVSAAPSRPVAPADARVNTSAAAKAVAGHFFAALDFAERTGDHGPLSQVAHPDCAWCSEQLAHLYDNDPHGGALDPLHRARVTDAFRYDASNVVVHLWHEYGHNARIRVHGKVTVVTPVTERSTLCLWWVDGRWRVGCASAGWLAPSQVRADAERQARS